MAAKESAAETQAGQEESLLKEKKEVIEFDKLFSTTFESINWITIVSTL